VNKIFNLFIFFLFISNCSLDTKTGLWSQSEKLKSDKEIVEEKLFEDNEIYEKEFNPELKIRLKNNFKNNSFVNNLSNNNGIINFNGKLSKISKYRFSNKVWDDAFSFKKIIDQYCSKKKIADNDSYKQIKNMIGELIYE